MDFHVGTLDSITSFYYTDDTAVRSTHISRKHSCCNLDLSFEVWDKSTTPILCRRSKPSFQLSHVLGTQPESLLQEVLSNPGPENGGRNSQQSGVLAVEAPQNSGRLITHVHLEVD